MIITKTICEKSDEQNIRIIQKTRLDSYGLSFFLILLLILPLLLVIVSTD